MSSAAASARREVARFPFFDHNGTPLFYEVKYDPKSFTLCRDSGVTAAGTGALPPGGIVWGLNAGYYLREGDALVWKAARDGGPDAVWLEECPRELFNLPDVLDATDVIVCEGPKDALAAIALGFVATTNPQGAGQWKQKYAEALRGKNVAIVPDLDDPGRKHGDKVARSLRGIAASVKIVLLPFPAEHPGKDLSDWLAAGRTAEQLAELIAQAPEASSGEDEGEPDAASAQAKQSTVLTNSCRDVQLFHAQDRPYGVISVNGHREIWQLKSQSFRNFLLSRFLKAEGKAPSAEALRETLDTLCARAQHEGKLGKVGTRVLRFEGNIYVFVADEQWRVIEITGGRWRILAEAPALFIKTRGMRALPMPVADGDLRELKNLLHVSKEHWILITAWLLGALHPEGPYVILCLHGEHGSAKSTIARALRELVDPFTPLTSLSPQGREGLDYCRPQLVGHRQR
jgi:hypothetical protein